MKFKFGKSYIKMKEGGIAWSISKCNLKPHIIKEVLSKNNDI